MIVPDHLELASFLRRLSAALLDVLVFALPMSSLLLLFLPGARPAFLLAPLVLLAGVLVLWALSFRSGQTPGKFLAGIRVLREDGRPLGWGMMFVREMLLKRALGMLLFGLTGGLFLVIDHLWCLWDVRRQTLHDKMCGSLVVLSARPAGGPGGSMPGGSMPVSQPDLREVSS